MVPPVNLYLVGGYIKDGSTRKDIDILGILSQEDFELTFGYTHETLHRAFKEEQHTAKFKIYMMANRTTGWFLTRMFGKRVDFKWNPPTMLYKPYVLLHLEADVTMYL